MDNILEVKKLKVSFRTLNGTVKAVREISFDLQRGETLAIVGESGSGKSVTSKAARSSTTAKISSRCPRRICTRSAAIKSP